MRLRAGLVVVVWVVFSLVGAASASAATYTVIGFTDGPGSCSVTTCTTLRSAVIAANAASSPTTIFVPSGTYNLTIVPPTAAGTPAPDPGSGDLDITSSYPVTITGDGAAATIIDSSAAHDRAFAVAAGGSLTLGGVTVQHGAPNVHSTGSQSGGAIVSAGALTLTNDAFTSNAATSGTSAYGGAIYENGAVPPDALTIRSTAFTNNRASLRGGAIADDGAGVLTVTGDTFGALNAPSGNNGGEQGGAIYDSRSSAATIDDSTFVGNQAPVTDNTGFAYGGGALWLSGHSYALDRDELDNNFAGALGGAVFWAGGALTSHGSSFVNNRATKLGGAILAATTQPLALTNATLTLNTGSAGGGIYFASSTPVDLVNDTLYDNLASSSVGGNEIYGTVALTANAVGVQNTILGNDGTSQYAGEPNCADTTGASALPVGVDLGHNLATDNSCLSGVSGDRPGTTLALGAPAGNGGTVLTDAELPAAPTIDAGTSETAVCPGRDARGISRPQGSTCDIGAYEFVPPPTPAATTTATTVTTTTSPPGPGPGTPPIATTRGVLGARSTSAFLGGTVNAHSQATSYMFQVGTMRSYGLTTVTGHTDVAILSVDTLIQRLKPLTLYHYRLVATNAAGTSYGADRTFRTAPAYDGSLKLGGTTLTVHGGQVLVPLSCASTKPCVLRFSITIAVRLARTHKLGTLSFTRSTTTLKRIPARRTVTVSTRVNPAALALLDKAPHHRLAGKLSTRPRTHQLNIISAVTLASR